MSKKTKVAFDLEGLNGNAYAILAAWRGAARRQGIPSEEIDAITQKAKSGDYHQLVGILMEHSSPPTASPLPSRREVW